MIMVLDSVNKTHGVPESVFETYLKATSLWPQRRGGINLYLIAQLFSSIVTPESWRDFMMSVLSSNQAERAFDAMNRLHRQAGISRGITRNDVERDWISAKSSLHRSIIYFLSNVDPISDLNPSDLISEDRVYMTGEIILDELNKHMLDSIREMSFSGMEVLEQNKKLATIYRFSFFSKDQQNKELDLKRKFYSKYINFYFPSMEQDKGIHLTSEILFDKIREMLSEEFESKFPAICKDWLLWGFRPLKVSK